MRVMSPFFAALGGQEMALRGPWAMVAPDGLVGGVPLSKPDRGASRRRSEAGGRLASAVLAHLPLAIAVIDAGVRLLFWNQQAAGLFGVPPLMAADAPPLEDILAGIADLTPQQRDRMVVFAATHIAGGDRVEPEGWLRNPPRAGPPDHSQGAGDRIASMDAGDRRRRAFRVGGAEWGGARWRCRHCLTGL